VSGPADMDLVERVLTESAVDRTVEAAGWGGYFQALAAAIGESLARWLAGFPSLRPVLTTLGPVAIVLVALVLLWVLYAWLRGVMAARRRRGLAQPAAPSVGSDVSVLPQRDRAAWRAQIDERLARGDVAGALEALWWWFARSVSAAPVDPAWTNHELLARSRRSDLAPFARALDRLLYGPDRPRVEELRSFLGRLEKALP